MDMKILRKILIILGCIFTLFACLNNSNAAYISANASTITGEPGQTVSITVSSDCVGRVNLAVDNGTLSESKVWIEGAAQTVTVTLGESGTTTVTASPEGGKMSNNGVDVDVNGTSAGITINTKVDSNQSENTNAEPSQPQENNQPSNEVKEENNAQQNNAQPEEKKEEVKEEKKSSNANLSNLGITPNDFTGFKPGVTTYDVEVENDVTSVQVYANVQDAKSKISGTGTKELNEGQNALNVEVTAEDGTTKTYTINVNRKTAEESEEDEEEITNVLGLSKLEIKGAELTPEFKTDVYEYRVKYIGEDTLLNITTELGKEDSKVEIVGNENLKEGENLVNILVTDVTGENTVTYQLTVNKSLVEEQPLANQNQIGEQQGDNKTAIIIGIVAIIVLVIVIIALIIRARNKKLEEQYSIRYSDFDEDEDFNYSYEEEIEENVEEFNNQILEGPTEKKKSKGKRFK